MWNQGPFMFITYFKHYLCLCLLSYVCGCSPFLDDPAPYPPDPNLQDQMLVDSTLRYDQFVPNPSPTPPEMDQMTAVEGGMMSGGSTDSEDMGNGGGMTTGGSMNLEENASPLWVDDSDQNLGGRLLDENESK